jgi:hypothetical protein
MGMVDIADLSQELHGAVVALRMMRKRVSDLQERVAAAKAKLEETPEWAHLQELQEMMAASKQQENERKAVVTQVGHRMFQVTKLKTLGFGVGVRESAHKVPVYDKEKVTEWAKKNAPFLMVLDTAMFESIAGNTPGAPVEFREEVSITITVAKDLDKELGDG